MKFALASPAVPKAATDASTNVTAVAVMRLIGPSPLRQEFPPPRSGCQGPALARSVIHAVAEVVPGPQTA